MSFTTIQPDVLLDAAGDLLGIGSAMATGNTAATPSTTAVLPPAADEVSALIAAQFAAHAALYQEVSARAAAIHDQMVAALSTGAAQYRATEAANAAAVG